MTTFVNTTEAVVGGLYGAAAGDALGATVEFLNPAEIQRRHGTHCEMIGGGAFGWRPGQGTDDTDLTWAVITGYRNAHGRHDQVVDCIAQQFLNWYRSGPPDIGNTTRQSLAALAAHNDPTTSGQTADHMSGNGSLMRTLPTALIRRDPDVRRDETEAISAITHANRQCIDSCIAYNEIAAALLHGESVGEAIDTARDLDLDPTVRAALNTPAATPAAELRTSGYVIDSLSCAVWAIQQPGDFESTIVTLVNRGDDADTTAAIAGGLLGIKAGAHGIPTRWIDKLEYAPQLLDAVSDLMRISNES